MGNCQATEAATVVIQHAGTKVERIYWSVSAREVMKSNPGHFVALVVTAVKSHNGAPSKQLKLLRPNDTLLIGHVYRLVSFQDVLREFAEKKSVKLGKLLKERAAEMHGSEKMKQQEDLLALNSRVKPKSTDGIATTCAKKEEEGCKAEGSSKRGRGGASRNDKSGNGGGGQWKPALQSIAEVGT